MRRRTDANHKDFLAMLRRFQIPYQDLSAVGKGCPDILALIRGVWCLIEVKDGKKPPSHRKLTPDQEEWHDFVKRRGGVIYILTSTDELLHLIGARIAA